ncbi:MAG: hypothetical protein IPM54_27850 [Polyangiaceae bacterium]|nr:hypothetical protein [Polyangiaceae bacterium]
MDVAESIAFDVLDVLGGAFTLVKPNATLDGSLPLRAARACLPLLDGNRFGFQIQLTQRLTFSRTFAGVKLGALPEMLSRAVCGSMPRVFSEGLFDARGAWADAFAGGIAHRAGRRGISLFTGLFVRPRPGYWLRLGHAGNRRNLAFDVEERWIANSNEFAPLVVTMTFHPDAPFPLSIHGEIATLMPLVPNVRFDRLSRADAEKLGRAHVDFYDEKYFAQKKRGSTRKYRLMVDRAEQPTLPQSSGFATLGPSCIERDMAKAFLTARGIEERASAGNGESDVDVMAFKNALSLSCYFDGHHAEVKPDQTALGEFASQTCDAWKSVFGAEFVNQHRGAMWYFTKYVTPHQPGEPYFFVKPPALVSTAAEHSVLIEGIPGRGYSVLRGVVGTDVFHAVPAVFRVDQPLRWIDIPAGTELAKMIPFPRRVMEAGFDVVEWRHAPRMMGG